MITGDSIPKLINLETDAGVRQAYADKTAFQAAGWDLTWRDVDGTALSSQPTWTLATEGNGIHRVKYTVPAGIWWVEFTVPAGYRQDPATWSGEGQTYDEDSLAGLLLTSQGVPALTSATDGDLGDFVNGDSWNPGTLYIPLGRLTQFGYAFADLASGWTITAGFKALPTDAAAITSGITCVFGATAATDGAFNVSWVTMNTAFQLASTEYEKQFYLDIQLRRTSSSTTITTNRYGLRNKWERNLV